MKPINEAKVEFLSRSANEGFARAAAACFAAQMDPTLGRTGRHQNGGLRRRSPTPSSTLIRTSWGR